MTSLDEILKGTSRAFYLSLAVLPASARAPLSLAYLLARAADTIADSPARQAVDRNRLLRDFRRALLEGDGLERVEVEPILPEKPEELELLRALPRLQAELQQAPSKEREAVRRVVVTLIEGMVWDQELFLGVQQSRRAEVGLDNLELEKYTYLVAGCVGPFWTYVCSRQKGLDHLGGGRYDEVSVEFGKALQYVNILRDAPRDQQQGRYYLPRLESPAGRARFVDRSRRALEAFSACLAYPNLFPVKEFRHRMALLWLLALGLRTLEKLFAEGGPRHGRRVKVSRQEVMAWVVLSPLVVCTHRGMDGLLRKLLERAKRELETLETT